MRASRFQRIAMLISENEKKLNITARDDRGMSMVEVLIGFVILTVIMAGVYHLIHFSSNMIFESVDMRKAQSEFETRIYKTDNSGEDGLDYDSRALGEGDYKLVPEGRYKDREREIGLFNTAGTDMYSLTLDDGESNFRMRVYGFKKD